MKLLFVTHLYPPYNLCGSEIYMHEMIKVLQKFGHTCRVLKQLMPGDEHQPRMWEYDGVEVNKMVNEVSCQEYFRNCDAVICHLHFSMWAVHLARIFKRPTFHITHNYNRIDNIDNPNVGDVRIIYNCETSRKVLRYNRPSTVFYPIIRQFRREVPKFITLINLNENKGPDVFYKIASMVPEKKFMAVKGTYGDQILPNLPNVSLVEPTADMQSIYGQTRILLVPSREESFCIAASEAMKAGIPVIAHKTGGLYENCGDAALWADRNDPQAWVNLIRSLDNKKSYLSRSEICQSRARPEQVLELNKFITGG